MTESDFINNTLESCKRQYSKDEVVNAISKQNDDLKETNKKLELAIGHLESELKLLIEHMDIVKESKIRARSNDLYNLQVEKNKNLETKNKELIIIRDRLLSKTQAFSFGDKVLAWDEDESKAIETIFLADLGKNVLGYRYLCVSKSTIEKFHNDKEYLDVPFSNVKKI